MGKRIIAPQVDYYLSVIRTHNLCNSFISNERTLDNIENIFESIRKLESIGENETKELWFRVERGTFEDYCDVIKNCQADDRNISEEEHFSEWTTKYPNEDCWYHFEAVENTAVGYRGIFINNKLVIEINPFRPVKETIDISELTEWLSDSVNKCMDNIRFDVYNLIISAYLPTSFKTGYITRRDLWNIFPEDRAKFFRHLSTDEIAKFTKYMDDQPKDFADIKNRFASVTAGDFFWFCSLGYVANGHKEDGKSPKELYMKHAEGRNNELTELDEESPEDFEKLTRKEARSKGNPWKIYEGEDSGSISLYPIKDKRGYVFYLTGEAQATTAETVKFYLALKENDVPVYLGEGKTLAERLLETELVGIVPEGVIPAYCETMFPDKHIIDFINLPTEKREEVVEKSIWYPLIPAKLKD